MTGGKRKVRTDFLYFVEGNLFICFFFFFFFFVRVLAKDFVKGELWFLSCLSRAEKEEYKILKNLGLLDGCYIREMSGVIHSVLSGEPFHIIIYRRSCANQKFSRAICR